MVSEHAAGKALPPPVGPADQLIAGHGVASFQAGEAGLQVQGPRERLPAGLSKPVPVQDRDRSDCRTR
jgi:hypothetical protein